MKKILLLTAIFTASLSVSAFADQINPNQSASCKDANEIEIVAADVKQESKDKFGYTSNDRASANVVVWKSSNYTTVPITLGPNDDNRSIVSDHGKTGIEQMGTMGKGKVVLTKQPFFSRGDSIGDISGTVRITNTGAIPVTVTCK